MGTCKCVPGGIMLIVAALASAGCDASRPPPTAPTDVLQPGLSIPSQIVVFTDEASFSTSDVYDADDQAIRFNTGRELIWIADGARFQGYSVSGNQIRGPGTDDWFQVRYGTRKNGVRRAYLGWSDDICHCPGATPTIVDVQVVDGGVVFQGTDVPVPGGAKHLDAGGS